MSMPRKIRCLVSQVIPYGDGVYTVHLAPERPVPAFRPGQFLHLALDEYDPSGFWPDSRVFSIASSPSEKNRITLCFSAKGKFTARMEAELREGRGVWVKFPYGEFVVDGTHDAVLIAGGTGYTAFQAFIEGLPPDHARKVVLLYGARRPGLLIGWQLVEEKTRDVKNFQAFLFAEDDGGESPSLVDGWVRQRLLLGRVGLDVLKDCGVSASTVYYFAGPPPMVTALRGGLVKHGISDRSIRVDAWE
jgi:NAD(P)H-flavin reductase